MLSDDPLQHLHALWQQSTGSLTNALWYTHDGVELMAHQTGPLLRLRDWNEDLEPDEDPLPPAQRFTPEFAQKADARFVAQAHNQWPTWFAEIQRLRSIVADLESGDWLDTQITEILTTWHGDLDPHDKDHPEARTLVEVIVDRIVARLRGTDNA